MFYSFRKINKGFQWLILFLLWIIFGLAFLVALDSFLPPVIDPPLEWSHQIQASEGQLLRLYTTSRGHWRLPTDTDKIDPKMKQALLAYEDKHFYQHIGFDLNAIIRATWQLFKYQHLVSGASTITMQTVRLLKPKPRTLKNKLLEIYTAWRLEQVLSKKAILDLYLSLTPYGGNIQGLETACLFYFKKSAAHLTPSEMALLIALPQSPEKRRPDRHPKQAKKARNHVLKQLQKKGLMTLSAMNLAMQRPLPKRKTPVFYAPHLLQNMALSKPIIKTTLDFKLQRQLESFAHSMQPNLAQGETMAVVIVEKETAKVVAHLGSGDFYQQSQLDLSQAIRSPGSALKPFIYGLGFEQKSLHPQTKIIDQRENIQQYRPQNFAKQYYGEVTLSQALARSLNIPAVKVLQKIGAKTLFQRLEQNQVHLQLPPHSQISLALALGGVGINLQQLVMLYNGLARGGETKALCFIAPCDAQKTTFLLSKKATWYIDQILTTTRPPNGFRREQPLRFKTGTSYGFRDAWSIGYNASYTVGVWTGRPDGGFRSGKTGLNSATPLLFQIFAFLKEKKGASFMKKPPHILAFHPKKIPLTLQWFDIHHQNKPKIQFPINGSQLPLSQNLTIKASGGVLPLFWFINGQPISTDGWKRTIQWHPNGIGFIQISLMDSAGNRDKIEIQLTKTQNSRLSYFKEKEK